MPKFIIAINTHEYTTGMMVDDDYEEKKCAQKIINRAAGQVVKVIKVVMVVMQDCTYDFSVSIHSIIFRIIA